MRNFVVHVGYPHVRLIVSNLKKITEICSAIKYLVVTQVSEKITLTVQACVTQGSGIVYIPIIPVSEYLQKPQQNCLPM